MEITLNVTHRQDFVRNLPIFKEIQEKCESALHSPVIKSDPVNGMDQYVDVLIGDAPEWIVREIRELYQQAGWEFSKISTRYIGEIRFILS